MMGVERRIRKHAGGMFSRRGRLPCAVRHILEKRNPFA